jgi:ATP-dependent Clp protease ATP-binding subunit ClpC
MQNVIRTGNKTNDGDLTDMIGNILSAGDIRVVGAISFKEYRNGIESHSALSTKLQKIIVEPSTKEETFDILKANKVYYENFHHIKFDDKVLYKAINLAKRYITNNSLPDSALDIIDLTGASISLTKKEEKSIKSIKKKLSSFDGEKCKAMDSGDFELLDEIAKKESALYKELNDIKRDINNDDSTWVNVTEEDIAETVSTMTNIPISKLKASEKETILHIDEILKKDVIGQDEAINEISKAIKRARAGFGDKSKVMATLLCIGSSGCGKTLISKKLAENIFGSEDYLVRFDMSEYQDKTSVNKLIGSSAGYVGYENGGLLTEAIKNKPYCVLLFDEIEKADESIYNLFLQLFDEGRLTDNNGTTVNFKNVIVIMTSNVGVKQANERGGGIGFTANAEANKRSIIEKNLKSKFSPEFLNRIDKIIHFNPLTDENLKVIVDIELKKLCDRVKENDINLEYDPNVIDFVYKEALEQKEYGARPIMRIIQDEVSDKVVDLILTSNKHENSYYVKVGENGNVEASVLKKST